MSDLFDRIGIAVASMPLPLLVLMKATVVFFGGFLIAFLMRRSSAAALHAVWALILAAALALPFGAAIAPAWRVTIARAVPRETSSTTSPNTGAAVARIVTTTETSSPVREARPYAAIPTTRTASIPDWWPVLLWIAGVSFTLARMVLGRMLLGRIAERGSPLSDRKWSSSLTKEMLATGVRRPVRLFASSEVSSPLTTGIRAPIILLPAESTNWDASHREVVLRHELAHIANGDALICAVAGVACAIYWFHPLAWIAARKMKTEQERACDDRVLSLGTPAAEYASHLLEVARTARALGMQGFIAVAMARPTELEGRLLAVLNEARNRTPLTSRTKITLVGIGAAAVIAVAAFRPTVAEAAIVIASQMATQIPVVAPVLQKTVRPEPPAVREADSVALGEVVVKPGGMLTLDLRTGAGLNIVGSNENVVRMRATLGGRDWRHTMVRIEGDGTNATITTRYDFSGRTTSSSHHIDITVPRRFNIRLSSAGGGIDLRDVEGSFTGQTGGGEIHIENAKGSARLSTGGGNVNVSRSQLSGSVGTGGGSVVIQDVTGGLHGGSGTGEVFYGKEGLTYSEPSAGGTRYGSDGRIYSYKSGGSVSIADAPKGASIQTGGGAITIGRAGGRVEATTGGGDITIRTLSGSAQVSTGAGDVRIDVEGDGDHFIRVESGSGKVTLVLPPDLSADLDLETAYTNNRYRPTKIDSDWPLSVTETRDWDNREGTPRKYLRARQTIGHGGPLIRVKTINGNIVLRRRD